MARLTDAQKLENKNNRSVRDGAYGQRSNAYRSEINAVEDQVKKSSEADVLNQIEEEFDSVINDRNSAIDAMRLQISELERQIKIRIENDVEVIEAIKGRRNAAWRAKSELEKKLKSEVNSRYLDLKEKSEYGLVCVAEWVPPEGFIGQYKIDNADLLLKKASKAKASMAKCSKNNEH